MGIFTDRKKGRRCIALKLKLKKGGLHKALDISESKSIPANKEAIKPGDSPHMRKMKQFAINAKKWKH